MTTAYILHGLIWSALYAFIIAATARIAYRAFRDYFRPFIKALYHGIRTHRQEHLPHDSPSDTERAA